MSIANMDAQKLLATIHDLAPTITARAAEIESARELPDDLLRELVAAGCFRMLVPRSHGGLEIELPSSLEILEALGRADGSAGWTAMIGAEAVMLLALLPRRRFDSLYANGPDLMGAGSFTPRGEAQVIDGGFEVTGRWPFASGCLHSKWLLANCVVTENGRPRPGPAPDLPETRFVIFRTEQAQILDTWFASGLRGTGSNDIAVERIRVAHDDTFDRFSGVSSVPGPLYIAATSQFSLHMASVGVGIAQHAVDDIIALAGSQKRRLFAATALADTPVFQHSLARAEIALRAARALLRSEAEAFWAEASAGRMPTLAEQVRCSATGAWVAASAATVVDVCYKHGGGTALYDSSPLQRHLRDIHTLTQHIGLADGWLTRAGAFLLGKDPGFGIA
ncbi:MAG TPA: acyl-CoA dehydrogenase family protein [Candidatus Binataceae bacterium]|nr:acyl-CoA dehydrogenase family protein [Candidatus Binataceae bacterium]